MVSLKYMNRLLLLLLLPVSLLAQEASLDLPTAYNLAQQNYPVIKQKELVAQTASMNIANLNKAFLPQFSLSGQATYQSDVTQINIPIPGLNIDPLSKDQYKLQADVTQLLYDGGSVNLQKNLQHLN